MNKELIDWADDVYKNYEKNSLGRKYVGSKCSLCNNISNHDTDYPNEKDTNCIHCGKEDKWEHKYLPSLSKEQFIERIKTDSEFAETWEVSVNRRELTFEERCEIQIDKLDGMYSSEKNIFIHHSIDDVKRITMDKNNIPKKVISLTYNNKTIEIYE